MTVHFIGAGPGSPKLLTLQADEHLRSSQVIIYAGSLVHPDIIKRYPQAKTFNSASMTLESIMDVICTYHEKNIDVCRLQCGDLSFYSAIHEQILQLKTRNIPYTLTPGITSMSAFSCALEQELTIPEVTQTIVLTRLGKSTNVPEKECLQHLAKHQASLVIYLSILYMKEISNILIPYYGKNHPIAIGYKLTQPEEDLLLTSLEEAPRMVKEKKWKTTALLLISPVLKKEKANNRSQLYHPKHHHIFRLPKK